MVTVISRKIAQILGPLASPTTIGHKTAVLILASASPRRAALLRAAGLAPTIAPVACDESWRPGETPENYARRLAREKASLALRPRARILAADTTVWIAGDQPPIGPPIGKPRDHSDARAILGALADAGSHRVTTAFAIADTRRGAPRWRCGLTTTRVDLRPLSPAAIDAYLECGEWTDKAGGYAIQGRGAGLVRGIEGSYTGVVGLPLAEVLEALDSLDSLDSLDAPPTAP